MSADSLVPRPGDLQALNRYSYARNSPTNRVDPSGHGDCNVHQEDCLPDDGAVSGISVTNVKNYYTRQMYKNRGNAYVAKHHVRRIYQAAGISPITPKLLPVGVQGSQQAPYYTADQEAGAQRYMSVEYSDYKINQLYNAPSGFADPFDYVTVSLSACKIICKSNSVTMSPYGIYYADGYGGGLNGVGFSIMVGNIPNADMRKTNAFLHGVSVSGAGGAVIGVGATHSLGVDTSAEFGVTTPGAALIVNKTRASFEWGDKSIFEGVFTLE